ncbi:MAG: mechanosensitive ion channel family protein [Pseudomonadota bacterium]
MPSIVTDQINAMWEQTLASLPSLVIASALLALTWLLAKGAGAITRRIVGKSDIKPSLQNLMRTLVGLFIWIIGLMIAAVVVFPDFTPASLIAGLGIGTVAVGFAFKDIFENFFAGVLIMLREKMRIGDVIEVDGILGTVEHISLRETHIRAFSGELTIMPNSMLFQNAVEIWTDAPKRRFEVVIGVSYDTDLERAETILQEAVEACSTVYKEKPVHVLADTFNSSSVDFVVRWWADSSGPNVPHTKPEVVKAIKAALDRAKIEIPFPYVTHTFKEEVPVMDKAAGEN